MFELYVNMTSLSLTWAVTDRDVHGASGNNAFQYQRMSAFTGPNRFSVAKGPSLFMWSHSISGTTSYQKFLLIRCDFLPECRLWDFWLSIPMCVKLPQLLLTLVLLCFLFFFSILSPVKRSEWNICYLETEELTRHWVKWCKWKNISESNVTF